jgi:hypothetical protein
MKQDQSRSRKDHGAREPGAAAPLGPQSLSDRELKGIDQGKHKRAGRNEDFLARQLIKPSESQMR